MATRAAGKRPTPPNLGGSGFYKNPNFSSSPDAYNWDGSLLDKFKFSPFSHHKDGMYPPKSSDLGKRLKMNHNLWSSINISSLVKLQLNR